MLLGIGPLAIRCRLAAKSRAFAECRPQSSAYHALFAGVLRDRISVRDDATQKSCGAES
jgi:hypothetical protein